MPEEDGKSFPTRRVVLAGIATVVVAGTAAVLFEWHNGVLTPQPQPAPSLAHFPELDGTSGDASAALAAFLATSAAAVQLSGTYFLDSEVVIPWSVTSLELLRNSALKVRGNHPGLSRNGTIELREVTSKPMLANSNRIQVATPSKYFVGETLFLSGKDVVAGSADRYGYMRNVVDISDDWVTLDSPIPRSIQLVPRTSAVKLAPPLSITGSGELYADDPKTTKRPLIRLFATDSPHVEGIHIHHSGGTAVGVVHCPDALVDCTINDLLDDGVNYFGYGVSVTGSSRRAVVQGTMTRVRHSVTTNAGPLLSGIGYAGEPEDCVFQPHAIDCTNKSVDTHRLGWGTVIIPNVEGGAGGVQVRADNTEIRGGTVTGTNGPGIFIGSVVKIATEIDGTVIHDLQQSQIGIWCNGPANITGVSIANPGATGLQLQDGSTVRDTRISGTAQVGVLVLGKGNVVSGLNISPTVTTPSKLGSSAGTNRINPDFDSPFSTPTPTPMPTGNPAG